MHLLMLQRIHSSHQGPVACTRHTCTRDIMYWPGMPKEILHLASQWFICNETAKWAFEVTRSSNCTMVFDNTSFFFAFAGKTYLITIDYYSDFWELDAVKDASSETIIGCTKAHFARYQFSIPYPKQWQSRIGCQDRQKHAEKGDSGQNRYKPGNFVMA